MRDAGFDAVDKLENFRGVVGIERTGQSIAHGIRYLQSFLGISYANYGEHRAKDFFLGNSRIRRDMIKNRGRHKITAVVTAAVQAFSAEQELAFFLANLDEMQV